MTTLVVRDRVLTRIATAVAASTPGIAGLHAGRVPGRSRAVEVRRTPHLVLTIRVVAAGSAPVLASVGTLQRSVRAEVRRLTGLDAEVTVVVVDLQLDVPLVLPLVLDDGV